MRTWLIGGSLAVHFGLVFGLFIAGLWRLDRLEAPKPHVDVSAMIDHRPAAAASGPARKSPDFHRKKPHPTTVVQPPQQVETETTTSNTGVDDGVATGSGAGSGAGSGDAAGPCIVDCGQGSAAADPVPEKPTMIPPLVLRELRISGDTQIQPPDVVKTQIMRDGGGKLVASFRVCLDATGRVSSLAMIATTRYPGYDAVLSRAVRDWRYRPYMVNGRAIAVCGIVTFIYTMR